MSGRIYPDWVQEQKVKGTTVKKVGNNYYLYKHSSKRVPGKKNPIPVDTYIGRITPEGIVKSGNKKVDTTTPDVIVREYGYSKTLEILCPAGWKEPLGKDWQKVLDHIILRESPETYISDIREIPESLDPHIQLGAQKSALQRRMRRDCGIDLSYLRPLMHIYLVMIGGKRFLSKMNDEQKKILETINVTLEVH